MLKYVDVYKSIKQKIENGVYCVGDLLPTEQELQAEYGVSRTTVRRATARLQEEGLIASRSGFGTEVIGAKTSQSLNSITSISESLKNSGYEVGVMKMYVERILPSSKYAEDLNLSGAEPVIVISRVQSANGSPVAIAKNYIPEKLVPGLIDEADSIVSLYEYLRVKYGINFTRIRDSIGAASATFEEAVALNIEPKSALIVIRRICYVGDTPFEVDCVKIDARRYEYISTFEVGNNIHL